MSVPLSGHRTRTCPEVVHHPAFSGLTASVFQFWRTKSRSRKVNPDIAAKVEKAMEAMMDVYQSIGRVHLAENHEVGFGEPVGKEVLE